MLMKTPMSGIVGYSDFSPLIKTIDSYGFIGASGKSIPELEVSTVIKLLYEQPIASSSSGIPIRKMNLIGKSNIQYAIYTHKRA